MRRTARFAGIAAFTTSILFHLILTCVVWASVIDDPSVTGVILALGITLLSGVVCLVYPFVPFRKWPDLYQSKAIGWSGVLAICVIVLSIFKDAVFSHVLLIALLQAAAIVHLVPTIAFITTEYVLKRRRKRRDG